MNLQVKEEKLTYTFFGNVTVLFQRAVIALFYAVMLLALWSIDWQYFSWLLFIVIFYIGLFVADFVSGLIHLYIDYRPLNYEKGYGRLYDFDGDRDAPDYLSMKKSVTANSYWFDNIVYSFKMHHRCSTPCINMPYREFFIEAVTPSFLVLCCSLFWTWILPLGAWTNYLAFFFVIASVFGAHADIIHAWVHGSKTMPWGVKIARFLVKNKLIYSVKTHAIHHRDGLSGFCFILGHANFAVNWICKKLLEHGVIYQEDWHGVQRH